MIYSLNAEQQNVFKAAQKWDIDYVKNNDINIEPIWFLSGDDETGKSHLVRKIYHAVSKTLLFGSKDLDRPCGLM